LDLLERDRPNRAVSFLARLQTGFRLAATYVSLFAVALGAGCLSAQTPSQAGPPQVRPAAPAHACPDARPSTVPRLNPQGQPWECEDRNPARGEHAIGVEAHVLTVQGTTL